MLFRKFVHPLSKRFQRDVDRSGDMASSVLRGRPHIDKLVARELHTATPKTRPKLKEETLERVLDAWAKAGFADDRGSNSDLEAS